LKINFTYEKPTKKMTNKISIYDNLHYKHLIFTRSIIGHTARKTTRFMNSFITGWRGNIVIFDIFYLRLSLLNFYIILKWSGYRRLNLLLYLKDQRFLNLINRTWLLHNKNFHGFNRKNNLLGQIFTSHTWLGGIISNWNIWYSFFENIKKKEVKKIHVSKSAQRYLRKSRGLLSRQSHPSFPDLVLLLTNEKIAMQESYINYVPISGISDSNMSTKGFSFFIPGNDDSIDFQLYFVELLQKSLREGNLLEIQNFYFYFYFYLKKIINLNDAL